jgi:Pyruvate/2-oxoacid:ferredoxin oxidoreductase delta subunit
LTDKTFTACYLSGTGNSRRAALWAGETAEKKGLKSSVFSFDSPILPADIVSSPDNMLGLFFPAHGFTAPWGIIHFVQTRLPKSRGAEAFVVVTRGGTKFGPLFAPGMEGTAGYLLAFLLWLKGYKIRGVMGLDMPVNWIAFHWGLHPEKTAKPIIARSEPRANRFYERVLSGERAYWSLLPLIMGILILPISAAYLALGRFFLAKLFFASYKCDGCAVCANNCPFSAIKMRGVKNPRPYWTFECESCMRCMAFCPKRCVEAGHSFGAIMFYVTTIPVWAYLLDAVVARYEWFAPSANMWTAALLYIVYSIAVMFAGYAVLDVIVRVPFINRIFTHTTLTSVYRRYHEPSTKLRELSARRNETGVGEG